MALQNSMMLADGYTWQGNFGSRKRRAAGRPIAAGDVVGAAEYFHGDDAGVGKSC